MKVFIAGATGVLGHRLVERLVDGGHEVHGLVRDDRGAELVQTRGGIPRSGDVLKPERLREAVDDDVDVIVHAATYYPAKAKPAEADLARNDRIRREGATNLVAAAGSGLKQFVFPSVVWVARQPDGSIFDEEADSHPDRVTQSVADVETYLQESAAKRQFEATILRTGFYYAPDASHTRLWGEQVLSGDLPIVGGGPLGRKDAEMAFLHVDDSASAFADAIDQNATGIYHVVDDEPVTGAEFFTEFAELLGASKPRRIPGWLARFFAGKMIVDFFTSPFPTTNEKFKREVGWEPTYPTYREGLEQVIKTWENEGTL